MTKIGDIITALPVPDDVVEVRDRIGDVLKYRRKTGHWHSKSYGRCTGDDGDCLSIRPVDWLPFEVLKVRKQRPTTLALPEVSKGAVALVGGKSGRRYGITYHGGSWVDADTNTGFTTGEVLDLEGSVTVEYAPSPRTWLAIEPAPANLRAVRTADAIGHGEVYRLCTDGEYEGRWLNEHGAAYDWGQLREVDLTEVPGDA